MHDDWFDFLIALHEHGVRHLVVGAHALAVHGVPRATQDLDVWIDRDPGNADKTLQALATFGAPLDTLGVTTDDLTTPGMVIQIGLPPNRIDVLTEIANVTFADAWSRRAKAQYGDQVMWVLSKADLIANKRAVGRPRDLEDVKELEST